LCRKRKKTPKYIEIQQEKAKFLSAKLANFVYRSADSLILDDEKYFTFSASNMPGNDRHYTNDKQKCPDNIRYVGKEKFPKKILVWVAISERGISKPLIRPFKYEAIKSDISIKECLVHKNHPDFKYVFWPDLASSHYSNQTVTWMNDFVNFVPKRLNPPNVPQARPIENFWRCLAKRVYEGGWETKSEKELIMHIEKKIKEYDLKFVESLMEAVKAKLKRIGQDGVFHWYK
jgi:hypothetical protein